MRDYIYIIKPVKKDFLNNKTIVEENFINDHWNYLQDKFNKGIVKFVGRTENAEFGICVFQAENDNNAYEFTNNDPAVKNKVFSAEYYPFRIALTL
jgi:uncharacterized protein YciI